MILYLYAVVDGLEDVAGVAGVADEPLALLSLHDTVVVGGWMAAAPAVDRAFATAFAPVRGARLVRIDGSGHMIMLDQPARFGRTLREFLASD